MSQRITVEEMARLIEALRRVNGENANYIEIVSVGRMSNGLRGVVLVDMDADSTDYHEATFLPSGEIAMDGDTRW